LPSRPSASPAQSAEPFGRFGRSGKRIAMTPGAGVRLGEAEQELSAGRGVGVPVEKGRVEVPGACRIPRGEPSIGLDSEPADLGVGEQHRGRRAEPLGDEAEGGDRRLDESVLEGADVRLRVARPGHLPLGEPGAGAGVADPRSHASRDVAVFFGEAAAKRDGHGADYTAMVNGR
jgi:hypothetical protein